MGILGNKNKKQVSSIPRHYRENKYSLYRFISIVAVLIILGLITVLGAQHLQQLKIERELAAYENRLREFEERKSELELEIERLQETGYIETLARERLGLVKPDEIIFQLED